ncbi:hypothetical protein BpHYR1_036344 [Brachionus plicatilis]|uniref:Uncharacterized protein n=1 Tax=Brachionus plicatilis TaxID=10195 RepID=A0A3M7QZM4_BRAPC|nr:hypothetical protein BpHYR1_036344 [Brachionus plicatilis]
MASQLALSGNWIPALYKNSKGTSVAHNFEILGLMLLLFLILDIRNFFFHNGTILNDKIISGKKDRKTIKLDSIILRLRLHRYANSIKIIANSGDVVYSNYGINSKKLTPKLE